VRTFVAAERDAQTEITISTWGIAARVAPGSIISNR
jgi:hypothetical protein